jgi:hypothetical protein
MSEETNTEYVPYKRITLQSRAIKITRQMLRELANVSASQDRTLDARECMDIIDSFINEFQYFLGETCGDKASRWFCTPVSDWLLEAHNDPMADDKLDDALIMGSDAILNGSCGLFRWLNNLIAYGESCDGDSQYTPSTFQPTELDWTSNKMRYLMEENLGLVAEPTTFGWVYKVEDARGEEYGYWWFAINVERQDRFSQGKPVKLEDGSYKKDKWGKIVYSEFTKFEQTEEVIEVTKWYGEDNHYFRFTVPFGEFSTFFHQVIK